MANTKYELGLLHYYCDSYNAALEFLEQFNNHKPGQPVLVFWGDDETGWKAILAVGIKEPDKYQIVSKSNSSASECDIEWFSLDEEQVPEKDGNIFQPLHIDSSELIETLQDKSNLIFANINDEVGLIYHNGVLYSSPYLEDKRLENDLTIGETTFSAGTTFSAIITDIFNKIDPSTQKVKWANLQDIPQAVQNLINDKTDFLKKSNNLSDVNNKLQSLINLTSSVSGSGDILRRTNGTLVWGNTVVNWYEKDASTVTSDEIKMIRVTDTEWQEIKTQNPPTSRLYFVSSDSGSGVEYSLFIGNKAIKAATYRIEEVTPTETSIQKRYVLKDNGGNICGANIDIPADKVVKDAKLKTVTEEGKPYPEAHIGDHYIEITFYNVETPLYIPVQELVDVYYPGNGIDITDHIVSTNFITLQEIIQLFNDLEN